MTLESFGSLVHHCSKTKALLHGLSLHATALKNGMLSHLFISNHILNMHAKCGNVNYARQVFDEMPERNLVTWSAMISGYDQARMPALAIQLFSQLRLKPNEYIFASAISACASLLALRLGEQVHAQAVKVGDVSVSFVSNSLVSMYMKCGRPNEAFSVFEGARELNVVSYNAVIAGFVENQERGRAFEAFRLMRLQGLVPDRFTFVAVLGLCTKAEEDVGRGMGLHCQTVKLKLDCCAFVANVIMMMYSNFNMMEAAEEVFMAILEKDVISWNTFITASCHCDEYGKGLNIFRDMSNQDHVRPDNFTYASALSACAGVASVPQGKQIHTHLIRTRLDEDVGVGNALVNMYAKCGCIEYAYTLFQRRSSRNVVSWNIIINGFANHGLGQKAIELFERMKDGGVKPDSVTFVGLLAACNHSGLVDEGRAYFKSMHEIYGIVPDIEHFSCLVDLLGRGGRLREAEQYIEKFSFGDDAVVLGCLLSACRLHGDVVIGERLARRLLKVQPVTSSPYILLSNLYASDEMWGSVIEARKLLKGSGLKKEPGYSMIEVKGTIEKFTVGQFSNSRIDEIVDVLKLLSPAVDEMISV